MKNDFKNIIENSKSLPTQIGVYRFIEKKNLDDGSITIDYVSGENGFFTITIYNTQDEPISDNINNQLVTSEFEIYFNTIIGLEEMGHLVDLELLKKEFFQFEESDKPIFHSAIFKYNVVAEDGIPEEDSHISFLFLRSNGGYFHKIRFTMLLDSHENTLDELNIFLQEWVVYVTNLCESLK